VIDKPSGVMLQWKPGCTDPPVWQSHAFGWLENQCGFDGGMHETHYIGRCTSGCSLIALSQKAAEGVQVPYSLELQYVALVRGDTKQEFEVSNNLPKLSKHRWKKGGWGGKKKKKIPKPPALHPAHTKVASCI
jgi:hypothetical protein